MLTLKEVAKHNSRDSCWVIIERRAYDLTDFLDDHPGGSGVILRYGGKVISWYIDIASNTTD
jgi:L-lactate dehydrogenase (cytochrome)